MIIPTPEYDPMYADDGIPFRAKMMQYIEREFGDMLCGLGKRMHSDRGLELPAATTARQLRGDAARDAA